MSNHYNGVTRQRVQKEVLALQATIKQLKEEKDDLSKRNLNLAYDNSDLKAQIAREGSYKAAAIFGWILVTVLIFKEIVG